MKKLGAQSEPSGWYVTSGVRRAFAWEWFSVACANPVVHGEVAFFPELLAMRTRRLCRGNAPLRLEALVLLETVFVSWASIL